MSVSILVVDDETEVADLFTENFRREVRQSLYEAALRLFGRGGARQARRRHPAAARFAFAVANGRFWATADEKPDRLPRFR
jgi:hypothetical protein